MAVQIITDGDLSVGGAVVEGSDGTKYAVFWDDANGTIEIWEDIDSTPVQVLNETTQFCLGLDAAIDSGDDIHIVNASGAAAGIRYYVFDTGTDTLTTTYELISAYDQGLPVNPGVSISLDSNDKPHVLFVDNVKVTGSAQDNVYYIEKTGASWAGLTQIGDRGTKTHNYSYPRITLRNSDYIEAFYYGLTGATASFYKANTGSGWPVESTYSTGIYPGRVVSTTGGTVYRVEVGDSNNIYENGVDTTYDSVTIAYRKSEPVLVGTDRYIFYVDTSDDVHLISNDGGGWTDEGALQTGTYEYVIAEWAYNNENQSGEINYIFEASGTVYYDSFSLTVPASAPPRLRPLRMWNQRRI